MTGIARKDCSKRPAAEHGSGLGGPDYEWQLWCAGEMPYDEHRRHPRLEFFIYSHPCLPLHAIPFIISRHLRSPYPPFPGQMFSPHA